MTTLGFDLTDVPPSIWPYIREARVASFAASLLGSAIAIEMIGTRLNSPEGEALAAAAKSVLADWDGDICPRPPRGPHIGFVFEIAQQMTQLAVLLGADSELGTSLTQQAVSLVSRMAEST